jgi:DNA-binding response OmpR family regulator
MKLLVVDDCVDIVNIVASFLELSDHEVYKAHNGIEAVKLLREKSYNVVITDAEMPEMDGIALCKLIKSSFPDVYIVGISGSFRALNELRVAGADICFSKPFRIDEIEKAIENKFRLLPDTGAPVGINNSRQLSGHLFTSACP